MVNWRISCVGGDVFDTKYYLKGAKAETSGIKESCRQREKISCVIIINELGLGVSFIDYLSYSLSKTCWCDNNWSRLVFR